MIDRWMNRLMRVQDKSLPGRIQKLSVSVIDRSRRNSGRE